MPARGINLLNIRELYALVDKQGVADFLLDALYDVEIVLVHKVINFRDRAVEAVFNGKDSVAAEILLDGSENALEAGKVHYGGQGEEPVTDGLRIRAFNALTGDYGLLGQLLGACLNGLSYPVL